MKEIKKFARISMKTRIVKWVLRSKKKHVYDENFDVALARKHREKNMTKVCGKPPKDVNIESVAFTANRAYMYTPKNLQSDRILLYFHGGAYVASDIDIYNGFVARFCRALGVRGYSFEYPLAPENPYPIGVNACIEFYRALVSGGCDPKKIIVGGDSAGGGLAVAMCAELLRQKIATPEMLLLFSPWVDMTMSGETIRTNIEHDLMITTHLLENAAKLYCAGTNPKNAGVSPVFGKFQNFPPTYILAATDELLCSDAEMLHDAMERDGVDVYLSLWHDAQHAFIVGMHLFPESTAVMANIREFVDTRIGRPASTVTPAL